jgi:hypothetical protein
VLVLDPPEGRHIVGRPMPPFVGMPALGLAAHAGENEFKVSSDSPLEEMGFEPLVPPFIMVGRAGRQA